MSGRPVKNLGQVGDHNTTLDHVPEPLSTPVPTPVSNLHSWTVAGKKKFLAALHNAIPVGPNTHFFTAVSFR